MMPPEPRDTAAVEVLTVETRAPEATERLGSILADLLPVGALVALRGELASGKTCFVRGMADAVLRRNALPAEDGVVSSPTFTLVNQYGDKLPLYHVDLYRLRGEEDLADIGYEDLLDPDGICVIEWADRAEALLPQRRLDIRFEHRDETTRRLTFENHGLLPPDWADRLV